MSSQPRKAARMLQLAVGVGALLLGLLVLTPVVLVVQLAAQEKKPAQREPLAPLRLVPEDATVFAHIRVADVKKSKAFQLVPPEERASFLREICLGIPPAQVETVTLASVLPAGMTPFDMLMMPDTMKKPRPNDFQFDKVIPKDAMRKDDVKEKRLFKDKADKVPEPKQGLRRAAQGGDFGIKEKIVDKVKIKEDRVDKRFADKDGPAFPPGIDDPFDRQGPPTYSIVRMREDLDVEDLILLRPEKVFKAKGRTILLIDRWYFHPLDKRTLVGAQRQADLERLLDRKVPATFKGTMAPALEFASAGRATISAGWYVSESALAGRERALNQQHWRGPERGLFRALLPLLKARPATLALDLDAGRAEAEFYYADAAAAKPAALAAQDALVLARIFGVGEVETAFLGRPNAEDELDKLSLGKLLAADLTEALRSAKVQIKGSTVNVAAQLPMDLGTLDERAKAAAKDLVKSETFVSARRMKVSENNLKQIVLAMHSFHDANKQLPPAAICDAKGTPLLSWRVAILRYIDEVDLYNQFKLNEAWDSPHNIKLLEQMPRIYLVPGAKTKEPHSTYYQAFVGPQAVFELRPFANAKFGARGTRLAEITDGTSNTFMVAEAAEPVPWSKPADLKFDPTGPLPKLGGPFAPGFHVGFADGSVRYLARPLADNVLRDYITRNGGEIPAELPD